MVVGRRRGRGGALASVARMVDVEEEEEEEEEEEVEVALEKVKEEGRSLPSCFHFARSMWLDCVCGFGCVMGLCRVVWRCWGVLGEEEERDG